MIDFVLVTLNPSVKFLVPIDQIAAIREPLPNDELQDGTRIIIAMKNGIALFCHEDMNYFFEMLGKSALRRMDA